MVAKPEPNVCLHVLQGRMTQLLQYCSRPIDRSGTVMETSDLPRHQIIRNLLAPHSGKVADAAIEVWERMASQIISIVGDVGFDSLYARSIFLAKSPFPWLADNALSWQTEHRFEKLKLSLQGQTAAHANAANSLLLITFTDILAALIGEHLTTSILRSAWDHGALDSAGKELENE